MLRLVGMDGGNERTEARRTDHERAVMESEAYDDGFRDGLMVMAMAVLAIVIAGVCGGIELGTIPFPF